MLRFTDWYRPCPITSATRRSAYSPVLRGLSQDAQKACAHARLGVGQVRLEGGEVGNVGGARQKLQESRTGLFWIERTRQAQPQDLREIVIEPRRAAHDFRIGRVDQAEAPGAVEHARRRGVENVRMLGGVHELQVL